MKRGTRFGPFVVHKRLGVGSFAEVWSARHSSGEQVALKVAHPTERDLDALQREGERLASLSHGAIVHVYDVGMADDRGWMALELAQGTLADLRTPLPVHTLVRHLLRGLAHVHARGGVHRDIKPSNILIGCRPRTGSGEVDRAGVRLADFGIAWATGDVHLATAGTPGWAAPEQARGQAGPTVDLYALAKVMAALVDGPTRVAMAPWFARAGSTDPGERFPSAAHAMAALPSTEADTRVQLELPTDGDTPRRGHSLKPIATETRPVLLSMLPPNPSGELCPRVTPTCPERPPIAAIRVPQVRLLDAGARLVAHRPTPPVGRLDLLYQLWADVRAGRTIRLDGAPVDVHEVEHTLTLWAAEVGTAANIEHAKGGVEVPRLALWHLVRRAQLLGVEALTATWLAMDCRHWPDLTARLAALVDADLVATGPAGLVLRGRPPAPDVALSSMEEAWWTRDDLALARALADHGTRMVADGEAEAMAVQLLYRSRLQRPRNTRAAEALRQAAMTTTGVLQHALEIEQLGVLIRARAGEQAAALAAQLASLPPSPDERLQAHATIHIAYALIMESSERALPFLEQAQHLAGARYQAMALATTVDYHLQRQEFEEGLRAAHLAVDHLDEERPDEALAVLMALINAQVAAKRPESEVSATIARAAPLQEHTLNRSVIARFTLFRAQQAMRFKDWHRADRLLGEAQELYHQSGGSAVFIVLNHGLVGLHRGDVASIAAATPADWAKEIQVAPAYAKPMMQLHQLFADLDDAEAAECALGVLEALEPLPSLTHEGIEIAAELGPSALSARIRALMR